MRAGNMGVNSSTDNRITSEDASNDKTKFNIMT